MSCPIKPFLFDLDSPEPDIYDAVAQWRRDHPEELSPSEANVVGTPRTDVVRERNRGPWEKHGQHLCRELIALANGMERELANALVALEDRDITVRRIGRDLLDQNSRIVELERELAVANEAVKELVEVLRDCKHSMENPEVQSWAKGSIRLILQVIKKYGR